jgi:hypothetical protein
MDAVRLPNSIHAFPPVIPRSQCQQRHTISLSSEGGWNLVWREIAHFAGNDK